MSDTQKNLYKKILGNSGERLAEKHLKKSGYKILQKNARFKSGEADIIASKGEVIVFIEVKTRSGLAYGLPCEAVDFKRQQRYINIATEYISKYGEYSIRFDVIEILNGQINHIENAFTA